MKLDKVNRTFNNLLRKFSSIGSSPIYKNDVANIHQAGMVRKTLSDRRFSSSESIKSTNIKLAGVPTPDQHISESSTSFPLLGPPEIYLSSSRASAAKPNEKVQDAFMDQMVANFNAPETPTWSNSPMWAYRGYTENLSPTYLSSGNPCLDFFFHVVPDTPAQSLTSRLQSAWEQDPLTALKLVCNLRGVRGTGKMDKEGFYKAALWLHDNHPKTLATNAKSMAEFGYYKDLPQILELLLKGPEAREIAKQKTMEYRSKLPLLQDKSYRKAYYKEKKPDNKSMMTKEQKRIEEGRKGVERYTNDPVYRFLHDHVSDTFAEQLISDLGNLCSGNLRNISFAAKWCPSLYSSFDCSMLLCESIARRIFPRELYPEYEGLEDAYYAYRIRDRFRKEVLVPLRKALKMPEVYMSANRWGILPYSRVPSVAMKLYTEAFLRHDMARFQEYLHNVKTGKKKIAAGALFPHEIIASIRRRKNVEVAELQWQRIVDDLSAKGMLRNCLAICDVSGSMEGLPLDVSVALGLLVSELSEEPWKGKLITFSHFPMLQIIEGNSLHSKIRCIECMEWTMNTDFQKVFDKILEVARKGKLTEDQMIKRLFVFSDMEFDSAAYGPYETSDSSWNTDYEVITRKFQESGYSSVPEIVFWNLRDSKATPVPSHQKGVALVSGFSKNLLSMFLEEGGILNPETSMMKAISGREYDKLVVVD